MTAVPMSTETVKTVAWLWWDANATGIDTGGKHGRYKVSDLDPPDIRAFAVVARSDYEAEHTRAEQLAAELAESKKINEGLCKIQDDDVSECEYIHNEIERAGCVWVQEGAGRPSKIVNKHAERAEAALREVDSQLSRVLHEMAGAVSLCWEPRPEGVFESTQAAEFVAAAIAELRAAARAIVEGEGR